MPEIIQDLKLKSDPSTIVRPNVISSNIPANAIKTAHIEDGAVTTGKIANEAITAAKIGAGAVLNSNLAPASVSPDKLEASAVTETKIAPEAVTRGKISPQAVSFAKLNYIRKTAPELLALCPTLHDFYVFIGYWRERMLSFFSYSLAEMAYPTHYFYDANAEVVYMQEYDDNSGNFIYTKLQTDSDYTSFVQNHRLSMQYME